MSLEKQLRDSISQVQTCRHCAKKFLSDDSLICDGCLALALTPFVASERAPAKSSGATLKRQTEEKSK